MRKTLSDRKRIAAIVTTWFPGSHADLIASKFANGFETHTGLSTPDVELISVYMDQLHPSDIGTDFARRNNVTIYPSVRAALTLTPPSSGHWPTATDWDDGELAVDGVVIIGEHGDYPINHREQRLYPRRHLFEQTCAVFDSSGRSVPVFTDKHLSYNWEDAWWIYQRARSLNVPLMAGSSLPVAGRTPELEHELGTRIHNAVSVGYHHPYPGGMESYGFHILELLQAMVERRAQHEVGIASVRCLAGQTVWDSASCGLWSRELAEAALSHVDSTRPGSMEDNCAEPKVFLLHYRDGLQAAALLLPGHVLGFGYAARVDGGVVSTGLNEVSDSDQPFSYLAQNIQQMFLTGEPVYPVERTLLVTGALESLIESHHRGGTLIQTPHLDISYRVPDDSVPIRPRTLQTISQ